MKDIFLVIFTEIKVVYMVLAWLQHSENLSHSFNLISLLYNKLFNVKKI